MCRTHFCYRCGKDITDVMYKHFGGDACPTFDRDEVIRMNRRQRNQMVAAAPNAELDAELEELRRQYPNQDALIAAFQPTHRVWGGGALRRHRTTGMMPTGMLRCP